MGHQAVLGLSSEVKNGVCVSKVWSGKRRKFSTGSRVRDPTLQVVVRERSGGLAGEATEVGEGPGQPWGKSGRWLWWPGQWTWQPRVFV